MTKQIYPSKTKQVVVAILQHYFVSAWIPNQNTNNLLYTITMKIIAVGSIGYRSSVVSIPANTVTTIISKLWTGPKLQNQMANVADHLDLTVDYVVGHGLLLNHCLNYSHSFKALCA